MHKQTKATSISKSVKCAVYERDGYRCIICGSSQGQPNAHYIARSQGGLGIEEKSLRFVRAVTENLTSQTSEQLTKNLLEAIL